MKKRRRMRFTAMVMILVMLPALSGCGTLFQGTTQTLQATTTPSGASVTASPSGGTYTTPASIELARKNSYRLRFERDGYEPAEVLIEKKLSATYLILDIFTGPVGVIVDAITGGWNKLTPEVATVELELSKFSTAGPPVIQVTISMEEEDGVTQAVIEADEPGVQLQVIPIRD